MSEFIIPLIFSEDMADELTDEQLSMLADCTTSRVMKFVNEYLSRDDNVVDKDTQARVSTAYDFIRKREEFLNSDVTKACSDLLSTVNYETVTVVDSVEYLQQVCNAIDYILNSEYSVPYIAPVTGDKLTALKDSIAGSIAENKSLNYAKQFLSNLSKYGDLFRDPRGDYNKGTVVKKVIKNSERYEILRRGIEFMINTKKSYKPSSSWRFL